MDILKISEITGVALRTLKRLEKAGFLKVTVSAEHPVLTKIQYGLRKGNALTAEQLLMLFLNPAWFDKLGRFEDSARVLVARLGNIEGEKMPWSISAGMVWAAANERDSLDPILDWLKHFIDASPAFDEGRTQGHAYMASRIMADIPDNSRVQNFQLISKLMWAVRRCPDFAGYWFVDDKKRTQYRRPAKKSVASLDL